MWHRILAICFAFGVLLSAPAAQAQDDSARAIELISSANKAYDSGDFRAALKDYRAAYEITDDGRILYRIGLTYENLRNYQRAREHLELYMLEESDSQYAGRVNAKIKTLKDLEAKLQAVVRIQTTPEGAKVWVDLEDGPPVGITPVRVPVGPGEHTVVITKPGYDTVRETVVVGDGETVEKSFELEGGGVAEAVPKETPPEAAAPTNPQVAPELLKGEMSVRRIGPSPAITGLAWTSIALGWAIGVSAIVFAALDANAELYGGSFLVGAGLVALGSYFLWFKDYRHQLPPATQGMGDAPTQRVIGLGIRF